MAVAVALSVALQGEASRRHGGNSGGDGSSIAVSKSVAMAVVRVSGPLGNVDGSKRVGSVVAGGGVAVRLVGSDGGGGAVAADGDGGRGGRGGIGSSEGRGASGENSSVTSTVASIAVSTESAVAVRSVVGISLSLPLGDVTSTKGVSNIVAGGSVAVGHVGSDGLQTVSSVASIASIANVSSVAKTVSTIAGVAQAVTIRAVVGIGLSGGQGQAASLDIFKYSKYCCTNKIK